MTEPDPRFLAGETMVLTDTASMRWTVVMGHDGAVDMRAAVDKATLAADLRRVVDYLEGSAS